MIAFTNNTFSHIVWSIHTRWTPNNQNIPTINFFHRCSWHIIRIYFIIIANHISQYTINIFRRNTFNWSFCNSIIFLHTNQYIPTSNIIKVICKSTDTMINRIWVPTTFKFYSMPFYLLFTKQIFYINW